MEVCIFRDATFSERGIARSSRAGRRYAGRKPDLGGRSPLDVLALERTHGYHGKYHVLHGAISPVEGTGPEDLRIRELIQRVRTRRIRMVIFATNPSMEGEETLMYLSKQLQGTGVKMARRPRLPIGGDLE